MKEVLPLRIHKFHGTGNDFIILDSRENKPVDPLKVSQILCNRHFSVGADTLLYLEDSIVADLKVRICEIDGSESSMCGNGLRCIGLYTMRKCGKKAITVETLGGVKKVTFVEDSLFEVAMGQLVPIGDFLNPISDLILDQISFSNHRFYVVCPSEPHAVCLVDDMRAIDVSFAIDIARRINKFPYGINVDFIMIRDGTVFMRTFERGVWRETLACGTGAVASAYVARAVFGLRENPVKVAAKGGSLEVFFDNSESYLKGEARYVFSGTAEIEIEED